MYFIKKNNLKIILVFTKYLAFFIEASVKNTKYFEEMCF